MSRISLIPDTSWHDSFSFDSLPAKRKFLWKVKMQRKRHWFGRINGDRCWIAGSTALRILTPRIKEGLSPEFYQWTVLQPRKHMPECFFCFFFFLTFYGLRRGLLTLSLRCFYFIWGERRDSNQSYRYWVLLAAPPRYPWDMPALNARQNVTVLTAERMSKTKQPARLLATRKRSRCTGCRSTHCLQGSENLCENRASIAYPPWFRPDGPGAKFRLNLTSDHGSGNGSYYPIKRVKEALGSFTSTPSYKYSVHCTVHP
jgi:hypothetical protein